MKPTEFRRLVFDTPFRPVRITLDSGETFVVRHPENLVSIENWAMASTSEGMTFFQISGVSAVTHVRNNRAKRR